MADHKITDFVDQSAIDGLQRLKGEMQAVKDAYITIAGELAKGLKLPIDNLEQLQSLTAQVANLQQRASEATSRHNAVVTEHNRIVANTTNTISRQLMEQERVNKTFREAYTGYDAVKQSLGRLSQGYGQMVKDLNSLDRGIAATKAGLKENEKQYADGKRSVADYMATQEQLTANLRAAQLERSKLVAEMKREEKAAASADGSYNQMSQSLEQLRDKYKDLSAEQREGAEGQALLKQIQDLDAHLKDVAADMGEFQRNVGNYAVACSQGAMSVDQLGQALAAHAVTTQDCIEQNKALEQAKLNLNEQDSHYAETVNLINTRIDENKRKILDVDGVMRTQATTVAEAEEQNKRLSEAIKLVDVTTSEGQAKIAEYNAKIRQNKQLIEQATPALQDHAKASEGVADQMLSIIGVNPRFGASLQGVAASASAGATMMQGLTIKAKALYRTLSTLIANPVMLSILGIGGVIAGVKWWYDYNKGLIEASRQTENFTGLAGEAADKVTGDMQTIAEKTGKSYRDTISAANTLVQQFGASWSEAYGLMQDGIVAGADMSGNMLANISRFAPALRDAGVSANEFMAILAETRNGVFDETGIQNIVKAGTRLRAMTKSAEESLNAVGISAKKMQSDLEAGNISMIEAVQQVSAKLKELPENSQEAGAIMKEVFGRSAAEGGRKLLESIADINTNLETAKKNMGELGAVNEQQMQAQQRLNETLIAVFKSAGTSFETLIVRAKTFVTQGLTKVIEGCVGVVNWFVRIYNQSIALRRSFNGIILTFKTIWEVAKYVINNIIDGFKAMGDVIEAVLTFDVTNISDSFNRIKAAAMNGVKAFGGNVTKLFKNVAKDAADAYSETLEGRMKEINLSLTGDGGSNTSATHTRKSPATYKSDTEKAKEAKEAAKLAKEEVKRLNDLEEAKLQVMQEGHEKELAQIRLNFNKKIREITGDGEKETQARIILIEAREKALAECERKYQDTLRQTNLNNQLACAKKGSELELNIKLALLEDQREAEVREAEKTGADVMLIDEKYDAKRREMKEAYAKDMLSKAEERFAAEGVIADNAYNQELNNLNSKYAKELKAAGRNAAKREEVERKHEEDVAKLSEKYAKERAEASVEFLEQALEDDELSAEERQKIESRLAKAKIELEKSVTDAVIAENERQVNSDNDASDKRIKNAQQWLSVASDALGAINDLASAVYDAKIERIEAEQEANSEAGEKEQERISELVEKGVVSEEEGEARKRAAAAKTAKKEEELEKKKQELKYKQAVWDKVTSIAQAGIATALAITQALPNIVLAAIAGAMGALQIATIIATPIPKYAKGTSDHPGGYAIVGDGGRAEIVSYGGQMYLTPDKPTLIDMPKGAEVYPDADRLLATTALSATTNDARLGQPSVVVNNNYSDLKREVVMLGNLIKHQTKVQERSAYRAEYEQYKILREL